MDVAVALFDHLDKVHVDAATAARIRRNLGLDIEDVAAWCLRQIEDPETLTRTDKVWNVRGDGFVLSIDALSYRVVTARREKPKKGSAMDDVRIIRALDDIPELRRLLIEAFDAKTHRRVSNYGLQLAEHVMHMAGLAMDEELLACFTVNRMWQNGDAHFQLGRDQADVMNARARQAKDPALDKALRVMGQVAALPHVKRHALIASDYAVKLVNVLHPGDLRAVRAERELQIQMMRGV